MVLLRTNLNPIQPRMLCAKVGWDWLRGSGEEDFLNFVNLFSLFLNYLPLEKGGGPSFEETRTPFTQGCFVPNWFKNWPSGSGEEDFLFRKYILWRGWNVKVYRKTDGPTDRWTTGDKKFSLCEQKNVDPQPVRNMTCNMNFSLEGSVLFFSNV